MPPLDHTHPHLSPCAPFNHHLYTTLSVHASRSEVVARIQAVEERVVMREGARALPRRLKQPASSLWEAIPKDSYIDSNDWLNGCTTLCRPPLGSHFE